MEFNNEVLLVVGGGVMLLFILIGLSSDQNEYRNSRNGYGRGRYRDDDWDDYGPYPPWPPYYPRRRRYGRVGFSGLLFAFLAGIIFILVMKSERKTEDPIVEKGTKRTPQIYVPNGVMDDVPERVPGLVDEVSIHTKVNERLPQVVTDESPPDPVPLSAAPQWEYLDLGNKPFGIRLAITPSLEKALSLKDVYRHRNVEIFKDDLDRYWVLIFVRNSQEMAEKVEVLELRLDDLTNHGCSIVKMKTDTLCNGQLKRIQGTEIWFCAE